MIQFNLFQNDKFFTLPNSKSLQTTMTESSSKGYKTLWEKEKMLVTSNFSFSHSVFKRLLLQTYKNQGQFGKGLKLAKILSRKTFRQIPKEWTQIFFPMICSSGLLLDPTYTNLTLFKTNILIKFPEYQTQIVVSRLPSQLLMPMTCNRRHATDRVETMSRGKRGMNPVHEAKDNAF